ncbi:MAG: glutathione S-transferase family protein [Caulobacteraceae bacterium]
MKMVIGTRKWSSWSMRPWLVAKRAGLVFEDILVALRTLQTSATLEPYSPSAQCPVLIDGDLHVWDSLAICEYLADKHPQKPLWPTDPVARAVARSACAQMHGGFQSLRGECPIDLSAPIETLELTEATQADVRKMIGLWRALKQGYGKGGPFLLGGWSIADAYFTPVATRFRTYSVDLAHYGDDGFAADWCATVLQQPEYLEWERLALAEG